MENNQKPHKNNKLKTIGTLCSSIALGIGLALVILGKPLGLTAVIIGFVGVLLAIGDQDHEK